MARSICDHFTNLTEVITRNLPRRDSSKRCVYWWTTYTIVHKFSTAGGFRRNTIGRWERTAYGPLQ